MTANTCVGWINDQRLSTYSSGKTKIIPNISFPENWDITFTPNHLANEFTAEIIVKVGTWSQNICISGINFDHFQGTKNIFVTGGKQHPFHK